MAVLRKREQLEILEEMYRELAPEIKPVRQFYPWPLIKLLVGYNLHQVSNNAANIKSKPDSGKIIRYRPTVKRLLGFCRHSLKMFFLSKRMKGMMQNKVLLFGYADHINATDKKNIYLHPCKEELDKLGIANELFFLQQKGTLKNPGELNNFFSVCYAYEKVRYELQNAVSGRENQTAFNNAQLVGNWIDSRSIKCGNQTQELIYTQLAGHQIRYAAFKKFLSIIRPKLIWTYCYYDGTIMAMVRAANVLKIPLVEYQHSAQYDDHFAYAKWIDADQYKDCFPAIFWLWRKSDEERIKKNFTGKNYLPKTVAGGNIFLAQKVEAFKKEYISQNNTSILVCLQGQWIPEFIENFIKIHEGYTWYFRLHPRYPEDRQQLLQLRESCGSRIEIEEANCLSLYELFSKVKFNITAYSGTALEAHSFGVKNIIFGEEGYAAFGEYIRNNSFAFVENGEGLMAVLKNNGELMNEGFDPVITDLEKAGQHLKSLIV